MWKVKTIESTDYFINVELQEKPTILKIFLSNFHELWFVELQQNEILDIFSKLNPLIEADKETLISEIIRLFEVNRSDVNWHMSIEGNELKLNLKTQFGYFPLLFAVTFHLMNNKVYFQTIVLPLLIVIKNLQQQNKFLCNLIKKKDLEIQEYKLDGAVLSRTTVRTDVFDENILNNSFQENLKSINFKDTKMLLDEYLVRFYNEIDKFSNQELIQESLSKTGSEKSTTNSSKKECVLKKKDVIPDDEVKVQLIKPVFKKRPNTTKILKNL